MLSRRQTLVGLSALSLPFSISPANSVAPVVAAGVVGSALLKGALAYIGGSLIANFLHAATITDVGDWIRDAVREIENFVSEELRRQLDAKAIEGMRADVAQVQTLLTEYAGLSTREQRGNKFLIQKSDEVTARLVPLALNYDQALFVAAAGVAYRLVALQALYRSDGGKGHIRTEKANMDNFIIQAAAARDRIADKMKLENRLTTKCFDATILAGNTRMNEGMIFCQGYKDGSKAGRVFLNPVNKNQARDYLYNHFEAPLTNERNTFINNANVSLNLAIECYRQMCKQIDESYAPPSTVTYSDATITVSATANLKPAALVRAVAINAPAPR